MTEPLRIGVVGAGTLVQRGILPHLSQEDVHDRVRPQAVCDPVPGRAAEVAARFGVPRAYESYEELLEHGDVDIVTIASPIGLHYEQCRMALDAGKHVHVNKTMTTTVAEATDLIERARDRGLKIVASPGEALRPHNTYIKELLADGAIGTLCWATCGAAFGTYHEDEPERLAQGTPIDPSWYFRKPGGGPLYDMTVYSLHGLTSILGPVRRVSAMSATRIRERTFHGTTVPCDADDNTVMLLDFGDGLFAFAYGTAAGTINRGFTGNYFGTKGAILGLEMNGRPLEFPGHEIARQAPGVLGLQWLLPHVVGPHRHIDEQHVFEDIMQLVDWVRDDIPTVVTAEHARHVIDIIESAYRSAATGQTVELTTTF
ncbi:Gfo/Idh/MocA family protein [Thermasporomyces composti]|uniref:Putative dehydrogenase n=1 Tax=Thermasporomyces composti TaxID=696763 RepID=A0A3D9V5G1_THECX|nr:Gfo/Idh/MocA family oxidoreductase [Thermasporomyces composti]REF36998.1 putative dehydrogenase [Thermasporomyces composti]